VATNKTQTPAQTPDQQTPATDLQALIAQKRALDEQIKEAKAAQPTVNKLEREVARQADAGVRNGFVGPFYAKLIARRVALGQSQDEAVEAIQALWREWTLNALANLPAGK
jgi:acetyl/propionyl-CoA carboxylase alpha subunit